jgi:hypothetical protein
LTHCANPNLLTAKYYIDRGGNKNAQHQKSDLMWCSLF